MEEAPKTTTTAQGIPGDPLNVGLFGAEGSVVQALLDAGWKPADPITFETSLRIAKSVLLDRAYPDAPVSNLYVFGRQQDLAFEKPIGNNARRRHHVRFWRSKSLGLNEQPLWIGAATFDRSVGFSHRTGQITHHIAPDIDAERDGLFADLARAGRISQLFQVTGVGSTLTGRNGGGDPYYTDGELTLGVLVSGRALSTPPSILPNPPAVRIKAQLWSVLRPLLQAASANPPEEAIAP
jgi:hypothetical protein